MKKILLLIALIFLSCSSFEEDHEIKEPIRKYLAETLHDPESMEEINWTIQRDYVFKFKDSLDHNSPFIIDQEATFSASDTSEVIKYVRLEYRAKNGYGALRKSEIFATYYEKAKLLQFDDTTYSYELEGFFGEENPDFMNPRMLFLRNQFLRINEGEATLDDFYEEYPEYE